MDHYVSTATPRAVPQNGTPKPGAAIPTQIFKPRDDQGPVGARELADNAETLINQPLPAIQPEGSVIRTYLNDEHAAERARGVGFDAHDREPIRAALRGMLGQGVRQLAEDEVEHSRQLMLERDLLGTIPRTLPVWRPRMSGLWDRALLSRLIPIILPIVLFVVGVACELSNTMVFLQTSGLEFVSAPLQAFGFAFAVVSAFYASAKFVDFMLGPHGKKRFRVCLGWAALPLSLVTIFLFAITIGRLHEPPVLFGPAPWTPPLWLLTLATMLSLGATVTQQSFQLSHAQQSICEQAPVKNARYGELETRITQLGNALAATRVLKGRLEGVLRLLEADRESLGAAAVGLLQQQRSVLALKRAQADTQSL